MDHDELIPPEEWVRKRMSEQLRHGTRPEMELRRHLFGLGHRYRLGYKVPGAPRRSTDIAFVGARVAVFVDGCFWHRCPVHGAEVKRNGEWWESKLAANVARDRDTDRLLAGAGWRVLRFWEHEDPLTAAAEISKVVASRRC